MTDTDDNVRAHLEKEFFALDQQIDAASKRYSEVTLHLLCLQIRRLFPTAAVFTLEESDQPGTISYVLRDIEDAVGRDLNPDGDDADEGGWAMNLYGEGWGTAWKAYADDIGDRFNGLFKVTVDDALTNLQARLEGK